MTPAAQIALIPGDGIGTDVSDAAVAVAQAACARCGTGFATEVIAAGAGYFRDTGQDIAPGGEARAGQLDAIFLGAIGLPAVRHADGTEISPHLRLRDRYGLYAGVRPVKAYPNVPQRLADPRAAGIDMVILRESTEGLFYSAAVHGRSQHLGPEDPGGEAVHETLRISRATTEKLHDFALRLAARRRDRGCAGRVTCVDKANVFPSMAFFRQIFDERAAGHDDLQRDHIYVDAMALELVRRPWEFDVMVTENMFGDILSDLAGGLVGGMGMAACAEIGDDTGLFQPAHGSAPDIMGQDRANPMAAVLSAALMLDYLADRGAGDGFAHAAQIIEQAVDLGFARNALRPMEFGGDMGTAAVTRTLLSLVAEV